MIDHLIPERSQELIRGAIACVLLKEFKNQWEQFQNSTCRSVPVFGERLTPISNEETAIVNICLWKGDYSNFERNYKDGVYQYVIEVATSGKSREGKNGDQVSAFLCQKLAGIIEYILSHPLYKNLELQSPRITHTEMTKFQVVKYDPLVDVSNNYQMQLVYTVRCGETTTPNAGKLVSGSDTIVKVQETELGYSYQLDIVS